MNGVIYILCQQVLPGSRLVEAREVRVQKLPPTGGGFFSAASKIKKTKPGKASLAPRNQNIHVGLKYM